MLKSRRMSCKVNIAKLTDKQIKKTNEELVITLETSKYGFASPPRYVYPMIVDLEELNKIACKNNEPLIKDPKTGLFIMSSIYLLSRKRCCGNGCMFCPYRNKHLKKLCKDIIEGK